MQLDPREHFLEIVEPAIDEYEQAEGDPTRASNGGDERELRWATLRALRLGGAAVLYLHHFADIVARRPPDGPPGFDQSVTNVRRWLVEKGAEDTLLG